MEVLQIAREAISNSLRHGRADIINVRLHRSGPEVGLLVQDNGPGFDPESPRQGGLGLANMQARATHLRAVLRIDSRPGEGTRVVLTIPVS
jgi:signal transduction histidine kinase